MKVGDGELKEEIVLPLSIFKEDDIKKRRASCYQRDIRSQLVFFKETPTRHAYYKLTLIGPAHEMPFAILLFDFFDEHDHPSTLRK